MKASSYSLKINNAGIIAEGFKENLLKIFWNDDPAEFCSSRNLIPWIQEEAEYSIKKLKLKQSDQTKYLQKIDLFAGEYTELA